jgi:2-oxoglutarate dehydrogenase E2 component (dihydrolipoamide succinyltransferase)
MPQMGVSVEEGVVTAWHVTVGDAVAEGQPICDVSTDKVDTEVVAEAAGVVGELLAAEGDTVAVGAPLARLTGGDAGAPL